MPLTVTDPEMTRYFMTIPEASRLILEAALIGDAGDLFVLDMGEPVRIVDLARDLARLAGRDPDSVPIQYIGLRPGEKLHESLFYDAETIEPTVHPKVLRRAATAATAPADAATSTSWPSWTRWSRSARAGDHEAARARSAGDARPPRPGARGAGQLTRWTELHPVPPAAARRRPSATAVLEVLDSGWLTTGARTVAFEEAFAAFVGARHAVAVNSATAALHLALEALGVGPGDEVIVPTYTFAASAETVLYLGARPVLVDVDPVTANVDPAAVAAAVTDRTRAVEVVHVAGLPADVAAILRPRPGRADRRGRGPRLPVAGRGAAAGGSPARSGAAGAFSFYATKTITTGEGGMLVTDDDAIADRARQMRLHGISRDAWKRYSAAGSWYYEIEAAGFKYNLTDLAAALGLAQLARADELRAARAAIAARYLDGLADAARDGLPRPAGRRATATSTRGTCSSSAWARQPRLPRRRPGPAGRRGPPAALQPIGHRPGAR